MVGKADVGLSRFYPEDLMGRGQLQRKTWRCRNSLDNNIGDSEEDVLRSCSIKNKLSSCP